MQCLAFTVKSQITPFLLIALALLRAQAALAGGVPLSAPQERMVEWTVESRQVYSDPFNDIEVDVVFSRGDQTWRVPAFWRGGSRWTVRFAPSVPGVYRYRLESTDKTNEDLNGHGGEVTIRGYVGSNALLRHGALQVSTNRRYFQYADGTPFYWLGDTWWNGLSGRLPWDGFKQLTKDRTAKGFTVVQICAGLVPDEAVAPTDAGFCNEGGCVWEPQFKRINPRYFDYADQRIRHLIDAGLTPAIVGAWRPILAQMGTDKMKKHWRYVIARYGAYPVIWIAGGEIDDIPVRTMPESGRDVQIEQSPENNVDSSLGQPRPGDWTAVVRYIQMTDPYHHLLTVHEVNPDELPLQDETLTDFHLFQAGHFEWRSIGVEVAQLNAHYSRVAITKPLVEGEIGYEMNAKQHLEDFQRVGFWLGMLNGAAGYTYGAAGIYESYIPGERLQSHQWSFLTWQEGMRLPGSYQIGLGAKLLRKYDWWNFTPHPEWITPRGTTLLETRDDGINDFHIDLFGEWGDFAGQGWVFPESEWKRRGGNFRLPYAAGIPGKVRFVYIPYFDLVSPAPPTILGLEPGVRYHAYYWEPSLGVKVDLGHVQRPAPGEIVLNDVSDRDSIWLKFKVNSTEIDNTSADRLAVADTISGVNMAVGVDIRGDANAGLVMRFRDVDNFIAAMYSSRSKSIYLLERRGGVNGPQLGTTPTTASGEHLRLTAEVRDGMAIASIAGGGQRNTTPIISVNSGDDGNFGLILPHSELGEHFEHFEIRRSPKLSTGGELNRVLVDAKGHFRGELRGPGDTGFIPKVSWDDYGKSKHLLLDAYRPEELPTPGDWLLVLEAE